MGGLVCALGQERGRIKIRKEAERNLAPRKEKLIQSPRYTKVEERRSMHRQAEKHGAGNTAA
jgi:hypothetical protein